MICIFGRLCQCLSLWRIKLKIYNRTESREEAEVESKRSAILEVVFSRTITITISQNNYNSFHGKCFQKLSIHLPIFATLPSSAHQPNTHCSEGLDRSVAVFDIL